MKLCLLVLLLVTAATGIPQQSGRYIVKLKPHVDQARVLQQVLQTANDGQPIQRVRISHQYSPGFFNGFAGEFSLDYLSKFQAEHAADIAYVEKDVKVSLHGTQQNPPSWGLNRVCKRSHDDQSNKYVYPDQAGSGVTVYVLDTGYDQHSDLGSRAKAEKSCIHEGDEKGDPVDHHGHGTHCAGTIGGTLYGVAKKVQVRGIKVMKKSGSGDFADVIQGMEYVCKNAKYGKTIISMSLGASEKVQSVFDAVEAAFKAGVAVIVSAGNENKDACEGSPSGAPKAFAVGASDDYDSKANFSNHGQCVRLMAPGVNIKSTFLQGGFETLSWTSMACPHVAGVAAIFMSKKDYSNRSIDELYRDLVNSASDVGGDLGYRVLYNDIDSSNPPTTTQTRTSTTTTTTNTRTSTSTSTEDPEPTTTTDDPTSTTTDDPTSTFTDDPTSTFTDDPTSTFTDDPTSTFTEDPTSTATEDPDPTDWPFRGERIGNNRHFSSKKNPSLVRRFLNWLL